jgi:predicted MFS family arabinose efflux permease
MKGDSDSKYAPQRSSALSPLRYSIFRNVLAASTLANIGGLIQSVGASWLMLSIARTADMVALVQASLTLPVVLLSLIAGAMADNLDRRKVMLVAQVFMLIVSATLMLCTWAGWITPWLLLLFTFAIGCGGAFNTPAWLASVGDMVPRGELPAAVALNSVGFNIARSLGPAIGGMIVAVAGAAAAFAANALSYIALLTVLARWRPALHVRLLPRETLGVAMAAGIRYVSMSSAIGKVLLRSAIFGLAAGAVMALMPVVAKVLLGGGPLTYGLLLGAFGLGAVASAAVKARLRKLMSTEAIVRLASTGFALALAIVGLSTQLLVTMSGLFIAGAGWLLTQATFNVAVQMSSSRWVVARALSLLQMATFSGLVAGSWLWGEVAASESISAALLLAALVMVVCAVLGRWLPLAQTEALNLDLLLTWKEPDTVVPVEPRSGPIVVTVEYLIDDGDILTFRAAMADRRRIRRRDGARNWRLLQDLSDPRLWIERYETSTWLEYIRHNGRITHHDATVPERLRALHRGPDAPRVRRMIERQSSLSALHPPGETMVDLTRL